MSQTAKNVWIVVIVIIVLALIGYAIAQSRNNNQYPVDQTSTEVNIDNSSVYDTTPETTGTATSTNSGVATSSSKVTYNGTYVCLPHRDTSGPTTMECAFGIQASDGYYYALDTSGISPSQVTGINTSNRVRIAGTLATGSAVPAMLSNKYNIRGVIYVTSVTKL